VRKLLFFLFYSFLLFLFLTFLGKPSSVFAFCEFGSCTDPNDIPNGGCPCNPNFKDPNTGKCTQEICSVQPPQSGACCAGPVVSTPTPTPTPFGCYDSVLQFGCFTGSSCPTNWVPATQNPNTICAPSGTCCWYNPPAATATPAPTATTAPNPTATPVCINDFQYNECVGCNTSRPVYKNSCTGTFTTGANQFDSACASWCTATPQPTPTTPPPGATNTPVPPTATPTPLPAPTLSLTCSGDPGTLTATWPPVTGAVTYAIRIDDLANGWGGDTPLPGDTVNNNASQEQRVWDQATKRGCMRLTQMEYTVPPLTNQPLPAVDQPIPQHQPPPSLPPLTRRVRPTAPSVR